MSLFTDLKATYIQLTGKQVPVGTSTAKLQEMVRSLQTPPVKRKKVTKDPLVINSPEATKKLKDDLNLAAKENKERDLIHHQALKAMNDVEDQVPHAMMRAALEAFPKITRRQFFHTAVAAGVNIRTAKNYFDRHNIGV
jgi:hypothetical protein